jgi:hypothetical protein
VSEAAEWIKEVINNERLVFPSLLAEGGRDE